MTVTHRPSHRRPGRPALVIGAMAIIVSMAACVPARPADSATTQGPTPAVADSAASSPGLAPAAPARAYVDAVNAGDLDALVTAFAPDGQITDVTRPIRGHDAIRTWARDEVIGGRLRVLSVTAMPGGQDLLVHWAPQGSSGWRAHYRFTMTDTTITLADLQYA